MKEERLSRISPDIIELVSKRTSEIKGKSYADFLCVFLDNIKGCLNVDAYNKIKDVLLSDENLRRMSSDDRHRFDFAFSGNITKNVLSFDDMMKKMLDEHGGHYIKKGLFYSMNNIGNKVI